MAKKECQIDQFLRHQQIQISIQWTFCEMKAVGISADVHQSHFEKGIETVALTLPIIL